MNNEGVCGVKYITKMQKFLFDKKYRSIYLMNTGFFNALSDEEFLKKKFLYTMGRELDLDSPRTFNEKIQWLKLYDRNPLYTTLVDKYAVKQYVKEKIGSEYIIPTIGVWDTVDDIELDRLPSQFVLKVTHDSGGIVICKDKTKFDFKSAKKKLSNSLKRDYYNENREWPYKNVPHRIICEKYMEDSNSGDFPDYTTLNTTDKTNGELKDYKFFCFNGDVKFFKVDFNRFQGHRANYYDVNGLLLPFGEAKYPPKPEENIEIPENYKDMIALAERLSSGVPFLRVDFYNVSNHIYFGELTFFPASGFGKFAPEEWDLTIGKLLVLPNNKRG